MVGPATQTKVFTPVVLLVLVLVLVLASTPAVLARLLIIMALRYIELHQELTQ